ncbi:hypothetical protein AJ80_01737 [Polytolypa hystricis UAMH7299]|uniref:Major facilitator superfamily (MFS) profile domain-containing protein n=1 Tax=Polytolypa hystricis (strain UAMH7299) TaxID=1447883 RepID=A0A2B7Z0E7_POLH7|nr:hypothetical protein AJ80_01737 [Polytolypa hystricis UAMH7299]
MHVEKGGKIGRDNNGNLPLNPPRFMPNSSTSSLTRVSDPSKLHKPDLESTGSMGSNQSQQADVYDTSEKGTPGMNDVGQQVPPSQRPPDQAIDPSSFPDGGLEAWSVVVGSFCALFVSFGWINCIGIFQDYYQEHMLSQYSPSTVAWIPSLESFMMFAVAPICGKLFDNYGPRNLLLIGSFLHVFGLMMASLSTKYYQFVLAQGICSPIGSGAIFYPTSNSVSTWFLKRRALALGIMAAGSSLGGVIMPIMVERLIPRVGFAWAMRACAFLILGLCIVANLLIKSRIPPHPKPFKIMEFLAPFREAPFSLLTTACFFFFFGLFLPFAFIMVHARRFGMSNHLANYLVPILNASSIFGRTIPGYWADRYGRFNVMIVTSAFSAIITLALWLPATSNAPILVYAVLYGFSSGAFVSLAPALVAQISDVRKIGVRTGTMFATVSIGALTGNPIGGALIPDHSHSSLWKMQLFGGMTMAAGAVFFILARVKVTGWTLWKKF